LQAGFEKGGADMFKIEIQADEFDPLFARAEELMAEAEKKLPDLPMSGVR
jgi:hypothetical protein